MSTLVKQIVVGLVSIMEDKRIQVREDTVVYEDLVELSRTYTRYIMAPDDDVSGKPQLIRDLAELLWTDEVKAAWLIKKAELMKLPTIPSFENP